MRKSDRSQINEINVVPYVDVMLVLLVVFMVTAPLLVQGIKIDLPETTASVLEESELEELTLTINKKGQFFIEFESYKNCLLYTSPSPRDLSTSRMPSSA